MVDVLDLRRVVLFEDLDDDEIEFVSGLVEYRRCPAETTIVEAGTSDRALFVVYGGSVRIVKRDAAGVETPIAEVLPGQHLGEVTFVSGGPRTATAITNEASELLVIDPHHFRRLAEARPAVAFKLSWALLSMLCRRMRSTDHWLFELMSTRGAG